MKRKIKFKRLLKLATFLRKLPTKNFDFEIFCDGIFDRENNMCGTVACAMGWTPAVFPRLVRWTKTSCGTPFGVAFRNRKTFTLGVIKELFNLNYEEIRALFYASGGKIRPWQLKSVDYKATPKQVATSIERFVIWRKQNPDTALILNEVGA